MAELGMPDDCTVPAAFPAIDGEMPRAPVATPDRVALLGLTKDWLTWAAALPTFSAPAEREREDVDWAEAGPAAMCLVLL